MYPELFKIAADSILQQELHMSKVDITVSNAKDVYLCLVRKFSEV